MKFPPLKGVFLFLTHLALISGLCMASDDLVLVEKGAASAYTIVFADDAEVAVQTQEAAKLLSVIIAKATGSNLAVVPQKAFTGSGPAIYVGKTQAAKAAGIEVDSVTGWNCRIEAKDNNLYLVGFDGIRVKDDSAKAFGVFQGSLKAATLFLEEFLNVRWLMPGPDGVDVPWAERLVIPRDLKREWHPFFQYVLGRKPGDNAYAVANNFLAASLFKTYGGHSYYTAVPKEKYEASHPEYFALIDGKRNATGNHLCISNREVQQLMLDELLRQFDAGYDAVDLGQTDAFRPCECDQCKAIDADPSERTWIFHRQLAERIKELRPGKKVVILSYGPTREPPKSFKAFPDNVMIEMSHYTPEDFDRWKPFHVSKTAYIFNWGDISPAGFGPKRTPQYVAEQIKMLREAGVVGLYLAGGFENVGLEGPVYYVFGRMLGDAELDWKALCQEYYSRAFKEAQPPMTCFYEQMYARLELWGKMHRPNFHSEETLAPAFRDPEDFYSQFFPPTVILGMRDSLHQAEKMAQEPVIVSRLNRVEPDFENVDLIATIFQLYRAYQLNPEEVSFAVLARAVEARKEFIAKWFLPTGKPVTQKGWARLFGNATRKDFEKGGTLQGALHAPFNWNFDRLLASKTLPTPLGTPVPTKRTP